MEGLQNQFGNKIQVVHVTWLQIHRWLEEDEEHISKVKDDPVLEFLIPQFRRYLDDFAHSDKVLEKMIRKVNEKNGFEERSHKGEIFVSGVPWNRFIVRKNQADKTTFECWVGFTQKQGEPLIGQDFSWLKPQNNDLRYKDGIDIHIESIVPIFEIGTCRADSIKEIGLSSDGSEVKNEAIEIVKKAHSSFGAYKRIIRTWKNEEEDQMDELCSLLKNEINTNGIDWDNAIDWKNIRSKYKSILSNFYIKCQFSVSYSLFFTNNQHPISVDDGVELIEGIPERITKFIMPNAHE